jgi:dTDP-4-dehydrorhamnose reductase
MIVLVGYSGFIGSEFRRQDGSLVLADKFSWSTFSSATHIINCVGDIRCEYGLNAVEANVFIPSQLARSRAKLIHISTSVVSDTPYYRFKMAAEDAIRLISNNYTIYRLGWLGGSEFTKQVMSGKEMTLYHESGYPVDVEKVVKYILGNLSNHNNEIISLGGECRSRIGWALDMNPSLKWVSGSRVGNYHCLKPDIVL